MQVQLGERRVRDNETLPLQTAQQPISLSFSGDPNRLYLLLMYDIDAPQGPYVHWEVDNIPGGDIGSGDVVFPYQPPNLPPQSGVHRFVIDLFEQSRRLPGQENLGNRGPLPVDSMIRSAGLTRVAQKKFQVLSPGSYEGPTTRARAAQIPPPGELRERPQLLIPFRSTGYSCGCGHKPRPIQPTGQSNSYSGMIPEATGYNTFYPGISTGLSTGGSNVSHSSSPTFHTPHSNVSHSDRESWISPNAPLTEADRKYCRCILEVAANQPVACNRDQAWFERREGRLCANPYPVCHASVQGEGVRPECGDYYDFSKIPDRKLVGFSSLRGIEIPQPYSRDPTVAALQSWQGRK